jgi:hypothetical protein
VKWASAHLFQAGEMGETPPMQPKINWLSEVAQALFGECSDGAILEVAQGLELHDVSAREFGISMPELVFFVHRQVKRVESAKLVRLPGLT